MARLDDILLLRRRVAELERRIARLEAARDAAPSLADDELPPFEDQEQPPVESEAHDAPFAVEAPVAAEPPPLPELTPAVEPVAYATPEPPPPPAAEGSFEQTVGLKVAGWVGAIVVVLGMGLGLKYAFDAGWIGAIPAELRLLVMALAGFGLIAAGELVYRRVNRVSAAGLFGAGVATLFLVGYAGHALLSVYPRPTAFVLMGLVALLGTAVAVRGRLVSIAVLSQVGGHLAPLVLGGETSNLWPLLSYVAMLHAVSVALAWWGRGDTGHADEPLASPKRWATMRWLPIVFSALWMLAVLAQTRGVTPFVFVLILAGLSLGELIAGTLRPPRGARPDVKSCGEDVAALLAVTGLLVVGTLLALGDAGRLARATWIAGYAAIWLGFGLWVRRAAAGEMLSIALRVLAAALLVVAVPVAVSGSAVVLAWGAMALGFGVVGRRLDLTIARLAALGTWIASLAYLAWAVQSPDASPGKEDVAFSLLGQPILAWAALSFALSLVGLGIARLLLPAVVPPRDPDGADEVFGPRLAFASPADRQQAARATATASTALWSLAAVGSLSSVPAAIAVLLFAWLLAILARGEDRLRLSVLALGAVCFATLKWLGLDLIGDRLDGNWSPERLAMNPVFNRLVGVGLALLASAFGIYWLRQRAIGRWADEALERRERSSTLLTVAAVALAIVGVGICLEIDRIVEAARPTWAFAHPPGQTRQLGFTVVAALASLAMLGLTLRLSPPAGESYSLRDRLGWLAALPLLIAAKFLAIDLLATRLLGGAPGLIPIANGETIVALLVLACVGLHAWPLLDERRVGRPLPRSGGVLVFAGLIVLLAVGGFEVWRTMDRLGVSPLARQVGVSVYWGVFAVACVVVGFAVRRPALRYFGLGLLAITLGKVVLIDLQTVGRGWRTLSFLGVGLLLLLTSVLYGQFAAKLKRDPGET